MIALRCLTGMVEGWNVGIGRYEMQDKVLEIVHALHDWNAEDLLELQEMLEAMIQARKEGMYSILEFEGVGKGLWDEYGGVDEFLRRERTSWDEREKKIEQVWEARQREKKAHRSILEFEGMDQESWKGVDVQDYINEGRDSWDHKSEIERDS